MKFFIKVLMTLIISTTTALACDGYYMGLRAGIINHNVGEQGAANSNRFEVDDNNIMAAIALGYRYGNFRAELEYTFRDESEQETTRSSKTFQTTSYMANVFYDLTPYSRFTPFVMGGLGMSTITADFSSLGSHEQSFEETNFTWSLGGGVSAKLTNRWNIDLGYRFYNMGELEEASVRTHEFYGGARYIF
ncbi:MAG: outer membrane beta-barrel protein [Alphaproteobacteria bacterium]